MSEYFWEKSGWEEKDKHLSALRLAPATREFPTLRLTPEPSLFIVRGPRQVGKSSWLKTILSRYPEPMRAFYYSCEGIDSYRELLTLLESLRSSRDLILLDEVSFVSEWTRAIKSIIDGGYTGTIIVTGSHAADLRQGTDLLPGRFGGGREIIFRPMELWEYEDYRVRAGWKALDHGELCQQFFRVGGMPASVSESGESGTTPRAALETYERWLLGDAVQLGKNRESLSALLGQIVLTMTSPVSLHTLAKKSGLGSHNTVLSYLQFLEDSFALRTCYAMNPDTGAPRFRSERKLYFTDPIIYWIALKLARVPVPQNVESQLAEMVGFEALARRADAAGHGLGFLATKKGEVDFFSPKRWAIELKWKSAATEVSKAFYLTDLPEKIVWTKNNYLKEWPRGMSSSEIGTE